MSVVYIDSPRRSKLYSKGMIAGVEIALDHLYEIQDSPYVYKNTHKGINHCNEILEMLEGYFNEMDQAGWPGYDDDI